MISEDGKTSAHNLETAPDSPLRTKTGFNESMLLIKDTLIRGHRDPTLK
jgi:hypothetical protein